MNVTLHVRDIVESFLFKLKYAPVRCLVLFSIESLGFHYKRISLDTVIGSVHVQ